LRRAKHVFAHALVSQSNLPARTSEIEEVPLCHREGIFRVPAPRVDKLVAINRPIGSLKAQKKAQKGSN